MESKPQVTLRAERPSYERGCLLSGVYGLGKLTRVMLDLNNFKKSRIVEENAVIASCDGKLYSITEFLDLSQVTNPEPID